MFGWVICTCDGRYYKKKTTTVRDAGSGKPKHCTKNEVFH